MKRPDRDQKRLSRSRFGLTLAFHAGMASGCMLILLVAVVAVLGFGVSFSLSLIALSLPLMLAAFIEDDKVCLRAVTVAEGLVTRFVVAVELVLVALEVALVGAVGVEFAREGAFVTDPSDDLGDAFLTPMEGAGGLETRLARVLCPKTTLPPDDAAPETEFFPDFSTSDMEEGGRDKDGAERAGTGVLNDDTEAMESRREAREAIEEAVPLTPMLRLSCKRGLYEQSI